MWKVVEDFPKECTDVPHSKCMIVFRCFDENEAIGYLGVEDLLSAYVLHVSVVNFSHSKMKIMVNDFEEMVVMLRELGIDRLDGCFIPEENGDPKLWSKFVKWFGFSTPSTVLCAGRFL